MDRDAEIVFVGDFCGDFSIDNFLKNRFGHVGKECGPCEKSARPMLVYVALEKKKLELVPSGGACSGQVLNQC